MTTHAPSHEIRRAPRPTAASSDWRRRPEAFTPRWADRSACYNRPPAWWDADTASAATRARTECLSCPVLVECLTAAMDREASTMWNRTVVRGGLTGQERVQLQIDAWDAGPYDAEEARLLALEALESGRPVSELAQEVTETTLRLGQRLAGQHVDRKEIPAAVELAGGRALDRAFGRAEDIMRWRAEGLSQKRICARLGMGRTAVAAVLKAYGQLADTAATEGVAA